MCFVDEVMVFCSELFCGIFPQSHVVFFVPKDSLGFSDLGLPVLNYYSLPFSALHFLLLIIFHYFLFLGFRLMWILPFPFFFVLLTIQIFFVPHFICIKHTPAYNIPPNTAIFCLQPSLYSYPIPSLTPPTSTSVNPSASSYSLVQPTPTSANPLATSRCHF